MEVEELIKVVIWVKVTVEVLVKMLLVVSVKTMVRVTLLVMDVLKEQVTVLKSTSVMVTVVRGKGQHPMQLHSVCCAWTSPFSVTNRVKSSRKRRERLPKDFILLPQYGCQ